jgi:polysaccharide chain length determinant protein (PEP-CTERM system associated)
MLPGRQYTPQFLVDLLRRRWWLVALPCALCFYGALLVSRTIPSLYLSETLIQIVPQRVPDDYVRPTVTMSLDDRLKSIQQQILSRTRLEQTIQEFDLYPEVRSGGTMEDAVEVMRDTIQVQLVGSGGLSRARSAQDVDAFRVQFTYTDPLVTMKVTERLASWFIDENSRLRGAQAEATNEFLEAQLKEAKANLEAQERRVKEFSERNSGSLPSQMQSNLQAIQSLQLQLQALVEQTARDRDRKLMLERLHADAVAEDAQLSSAPPPPTTAPTAPGTLPGATARQQLEAARQQLAQAQTRLTAEHPDVIRLTRQVKELEQKVAAEPKQAGPGAGNASLAATPLELQRRERIRQQAAEIESLGRQIAFKEQEERRLRAQVAQYQARIEAVPGIESEYTAISRDYATSQETYKSLLTKSQESKVAANLERYQIGEQFRTLDAPRVPTNPVSPKRLLFSAGGLVAGLFLGLLLVGVLEVVDSSFRSESDVVHGINLPVLAVVPRVATTADVRRKARQQRALLAAAAAGVVVAAGLGWYLQLWRYIA